MNDFDDVIQNASMALAAPAEVKQLQVPNGPEYKVYFIHEGEFIERDGLSFSRHDGYAHCVVTDRDLREYGREYFEKVATYLGEILKENGYVPEPVCESLRTPQIRGWEIYRYGSKEELEPFSEAGQE